MLTPGDSRKMEMIDLLSIKLISWTAVEQAMGIIYSSMILCSQSVGQVVKLTEVAASGV